MMTATCAQLQADITMWLDLCKSRLHKLSMKYLNAPNGVRMKSWTLLQVGAIVLSKTSPRKAAPLLILSIIPKQNKGTRISIV